MIFVTGPGYSGKESCVCELLGIDRDEFKRRGIRDVERLVASREPQEVMESLKGYDIIIASEIGSGVMSEDPEKNVLRERAGKLSQLLAQEADTVIRVICGIPRVIKGSI